MNNAPATSVVHSKVSTRVNMVDNHHIVGAHRELKNKLRKDSCKRRSRDGHCESRIKHPPKKRCTAYVMFSKHIWKNIVKENPEYSMSEVNCLVSQLWKVVPEQEKDMYKQQAVDHFESLIEQFNVFFDDRSST
jgi:hypothetical protein